MKKIVKMSKQIKANASKILTLKETCHYTDLCGQTGIWSVTKAEPQLKKKKITYVPEGKRTADITETCEKLLAIIS